MHVPRVHNDVIFISSTIKMTSSCTLDVCKQSSISSHYLDFAHYLYERVSLVITC